MGRELSVASGKPGVHTIAAHMDDGRGGVATDIVQIGVLAAPQAPQEIFLPRVVR